MPARLGARFRTRATCVATVTLLACGRQPSPHRAGAAIAVAPGPRDVAVAPVPQGPAPPSVWNDVVPGVRWRRTNVVDEWRVLEWLVVRLDLSRVTPAATSVPDERLDTLANDPHVVLAIDAGFFDAEHAPDGLLISHGVEIAPLTDHGGTGLLCVRSHTADLFASSDPLPRDPLLELAVQCGPRLIERDGSIGITRDNGARFARTAACVRDGGRTLDLIVTWLPADPIRGPGLLSLATLLARPSPMGDARGCERALNLDGGPSTGIYVRGTPNATHAPLGPVPYALVVRDG